jgi:hypothetical protein
LEEKNTSLTGEARALKADKSSLKRKVRHLEEDNRGLNNEIRSLKGNVRHLEEVQEGVSPFVRDHYVVALRTLVDALLYEYGWNGKNRLAFLDDHAPFITRDPNGDFSDQEIMKMIW